jgi:hypothetical protein
MQFWRRSQDKFGQTKLLQIVASEARGIVDPDGDFFEYDDRQFEPLESTCRLMKASFEPIVTALTEVSV